MRVSFHIHLGYCSLLGAMHSWLESEDLERSRQMSRERQQRIDLQASACWHEDSSSHLFCSETLILLKSEQGICYETKAKRRVGSRG